jgi:pimeloyl-ACP methyl ester carboxylesterase
MVLHTPSGDIFGALLLPTSKEPIPVALIIAGSGPTDRDGNNTMLKNNSLKLLATALAGNGIASVRYDKRGVAESKAAGKSESDLRFDDYVSDARGWIALLKEDKRFASVFVIGHSEGSLIGLLAGGQTSGVVSVAGAGRSADLILREQLSTQPKEVRDVVYSKLDSLKAGNLVNDVPLPLYSLFRPSVQPYLISWFRQDPQEAIRKLAVPVLIVQGANDIQVSVDDAKALAAANPKARLVLIDKMNHIFRLVDGDRQANIATYGKSELPISEELVKSVVGFILQK